MGVSCCRASSRKMGSFVVGDTSRPRSRSFYMTTQRQQPAPSSLLPFLIESASVLDSFVGACRTNRWTTVVLPTDMLPAAAAFVADEGSAVPVVVGESTALSSRMCPRCRIRIADGDMGRGGQSAKEEGRAGGEEERSMPSSVMPFILSLDETSTHLPANQSRWSPGHSSRSPWVGDQRTCAAR